jgi:uncharacterized repeat protein (TIGR03803 family)
MRSTLGWMGIALRPRLFKVSGNFYGTTALGGLYGDGSIFRLTPDGTETVLHSFRVNVDGRSPSALMQATDGSFYGTSEHPCWMRPSDSSFVWPRMAHSPPSMHSRAGTMARFRRAGLVQADDGTFYGTTGGSASDHCIAPSSDISVQVEDVPRDHYRRVRQTSRWGPYGERRGSYILAPSRGPRICWRSPCSLNSGGG